MNSIDLSKRIRSRKQRGQGMTEYIIIVALIAIAAIGVYSRFGKTVKDEVAAVTAGLSGDAANANSNVQKARTDESVGTQEASEQLGMQNFQQDVGK